MVLMSKENGLTFGWPRNMLDVAGSESEHLGKIPVASLLSLLGVLPLGLSSIEYIW